MPGITSISTQVVSFPVDPPVVPPGRSAGIRFVDNVIVHVDTADGVRGSSYLWTPSSRTVSSPPPDAAVFLLEAAVPHLASMIVGQDVFHYERIRAIVARLEVTLGGGVLTTAYSAIDMALWDAMCKVLGQPLYRLLGNGRETVPVYSNELLHVYGGSAAEITDTAKRLVGEGYRTLKTALGALSETAAVERVRALRETLGPDVGLAVDLSSTLTFERAFSLGHRLEEFGLAWIEDPFPIEHVDEYARLSAALDTPVASGETCYSLRLFRTLFERDALDLVIFEPMRIGGITGSLKLAALAESFEVPIAAHVYHNLAAHLLTGFPTAAFLEYLPWWDVLLAAPVKPKAGQAVPSDRPGIGLDFDADALAHYGVRQGG
jgi:L-alanine-DL-glutamate epimerase-like enolase superfamily enzyme